MENLNWRFAFLQVFRCQRLGELHRHKPKGHPEGPNIGFCVFMSIKSCRAQTLYTSTSTDTQIQRAASSQRRACLPFKLKWLSEPPECTAGQAQGDLEPICLISSPCSTTYRSWLARSSVERLSSCGLTLSTNTGHSSRSLVSPRWPGI